MKILRAIQTVVLVILCAIGTASVLICAACFLGDLKPAIVVSGSMEPTLPVGSVTFTKTVDASQVEVGDIVTVPQVGAEGVVTHRVVSTTALDDGRYELVLRGDANKLDDPVPYTVRSVNEYHFKIPHLGTCLMWAKAHRLAAALILIGALVFMFIGRTRTSVRLPNGEEVKGLTKREAERLVRAWHAQHPVQSGPAAADAANGQTDSADSPVLDSEPLASEAPLAQAPAAATAVALAPVRMAVAQAAATAPRRAAAESEAEATTVLPVRVSAADKLPQQLPAPSTAPLTQTQADLMAAPAAPKAPVAQVAPGKVAAQASSPIDSGAAAAVAAPAGEHLDYARTARPAAHAALEQAYPMTRSVPAARPAAVSRPATAARPAPAARP
ncbi:MAG: signal peptidase I, partial [Bifidobacteriaceae bacterium]|nr:signal peptidase I [Bifidobacteriaceae bacterium]